LKKNEPQILKTADFCILRSIGGCGDMRIDKEFMYCEMDNKVAVLFFNRPPLNLFTLGVFAEFDAMFVELETLVNQDEVRAIVLTTALAKAFSAGDDVVGGPQTAYEAIRENEIARAVLSKIRNFPVPIVAAVDGYALGGGLVLAMMTDYVFSSDRATFGFGEIKFGMFPNWGTTMVLGQGYPLPQIKHLLMSGDNFSAEEALNLNFVQQVVAADSLLYSAKELAAKYASNAPIAIRCIKSLMNSAPSIGDQGHYALETYLTRLTFDSEDVAEGTKAFSEKRKPVFHNK
jgi:enoyl-CoA hydratase